MNAPILNVFISQPMHGLSDKEIKARRRKIVSKIKKSYKHLKKCLDRANVEYDDRWLRSHFQDVRVTVVNPIHRKDAPENAGRLWYLGQAISDLEKADLVIFAKGYSLAKGCRVEWETVRTYEIPYFYEEELEHCDLF